MAAAASVDDDVIKVGNFLRSRKCDERVIDRFLSEKRFSDGLLGSTSERNQLKKQIDSAYEESLAFDRRKANNENVPEQENSNLMNPDILQPSQTKSMASESSSQSMETNSNVKIQEEHVVDAGTQKILKARLSRVPPLPNLQDDHIVLTVRHPKEGLVRRIFPTNVTCSAIYDWVGSKSSQPLHFKLLNYNMEVKPSDPIAVYNHCCLTLMESDPIKFEEEEEITCLGYKQKEENENNDFFSYGDSEADKILKERRQKDTKETEEFSVKVDCGCDFSKNLQFALNLLPSVDDGDCIILHRRPDKFWRLLFSQEFDYKKHTRAVWSGETASDGGGPYRSFLLTAMNNLTHLPTHFFGSDNLAFVSSTDCVVNEEYRIIGELCALAILLIGRGPHLFHPSVVKYILTGKIDHDPSDIDDGELNDKLQRIRDGETTILLDANIIPKSSVDENVRTYKQYFILTSRAAAMDQFKEGFFSICFNIKYNECCLYKYFVKDRKPLLLSDVRSQIQFHKSTELDSNEAEEEDNAILQFEMFLSMLQKGVADLFLRDFLKFVTGADAFPVLGFPKKIDVYISADKLLPRSSTCGLMITIPRNVTKDMLILSLKEGMTFGEI